jgi:hypothetical protein
VLGSHGDDHAAVVDASIPDAVVPLIYRSLRAAAYPMVTAPCAVVEARLSLGLFPMDACTF